MSLSEQAAPRKAGGGLIRAPQSFASGLALLVLAVAAFVLLGDLSQGSLRSMGPAMLPRILTVAIGLCGLVLLVGAFLRDGEPIGAGRLRGPFFVVAGIVAFAATIRVFGLAVAGPLALIIGGCGSNETRPRELVVFAIVMTAFCIGLFRYLLKQPMPVLIVPGTTIYI